MHASRDDALNLLYDSTISAEISMIKNEEFAYLHICMNEYIKNKRHRVFLKLHNFKNYSYKKISKVFDVNECTVKSSIHAAMKVLKAKMNDGPKK